MLFFLQKPPTKTQNVFICMSYGLKRIEKNSKQNLEKRHKMLIFNTYSLT